MNYKNTLLKLSGATLIAQTLSILLIPIISRLYSTSSFAEFAYWISIAGLLGGVITLKQEQFFLSRPKVDWGQIFARIFLLYIIYFLISITTIIYLYLFSEFTNTASLSLVFIYSVATSLIISLSNIANIEGSFGRLAKARVYMSLALGVGQVGLGMFSGTSHSLLIGSIGSQIVFLVFLYFGMRHQLPKLSIVNLSPPPLQDIKRCAFSIFSTITLSIATSAPPVLLFSLGFQHEAGIVALLQRFILFPVTLLAMPLSQAFVFFLGGLGGRNLSKKFLALSLGFTLSVYLTFYTASVISGKISFFTFVLGESWAEADKLVSSIAIIYASLLLRNISNQYFLVKEEQSALYKLDAIFLVALTIWYFSCKSNTVIYNHCIFQLNLTYLLYFFLPAIYITLKNHSEKPDKKN